MFHPAGGDKEFGVVVSFKLLGVGQVGFGAISGISTPVLWHRTQGLVGGLDHGEQLLDIHSSVLQIGGHDDLVGAIHLASSLGSSSPRLPGP